MVKIESLTYRHLYMPHFIKGINFEFCYLNLHIQMKGMLSQDSDKYHVFLFEEMLEINRPKYTNCFLCFCGKVTNRVYKSANSQITEKIIQSSKMTYEL